ncbi:MAG: DegQ family serine endoprotease [Alphaproteobacteria bacterium]|nr:DegQ family serine endoprotease [Alphaproteobacteria bacterium]
MKLVGVVVVVAALVASGAAQAKPAPESFAELVDDLLPGVVNISTTQKVEARGPELPQFPPGSPFEDFFKEFFERQGPEGPRRNAQSLGSGFIVSADGYIATNNHVIEDADEITVILHDETELDAELVGHDPKTDLALLKVDTEGRTLPSLQWGDSSATRVGDWVVAIGNPFGLGGTVTAGIVSARARDINAGPYDDFIQTDASINRGNSGGPMFNVDGEIVGINTAIFSPSGGSIGIGFAIPSNLARNVIEQLKTHGHTRRGWLGVRIQTVTDEIAESLGLGDPRGALVASVTGGGPAEDAGLQQGDVILAFDGKDVEEMRNLPRIVAETPIEKSVDVVVWRKGGEEIVKVRVGELDENEPQVASLPEQPESGEALDDLGLSLTGITDDVRKQFDLGEGLDGVVVTDVDQESPAGEKGLRPGDVIIEVGQEPVTTPTEVAERVDEAKDAGRKSVLLLLQRGDDLRFVAIRIDDKG